MDDVGRSGRHWLSPDVENVRESFGSTRDHCCGVALASCPGLTSRSGETTLPARARRLTVVRLALLGEGILARLGLLPCQSERREGGAALFLLVPLRLRLLLFLVAAHLTLGHGVPPVLACPRARAVEGFKRRRRTDSSALSLPRNLALARICCGSSTLGSRAGRLPPYFNYILN